MSIISWQQDVTDYLNLVERQKPYRHVPYDYSSHSSYSMPTFFWFSSPSSSSSSTDPISKNSAAFWVGSMLFLGALGWLGALWKKAQVQRFELFQTKRVSRIVHNHAIPMTDNLRNSLTSLVTKHLSIQSYFYTKNRNYLVCALSLAGSGLSLALGGLFSIPFFLTISTISAISSIALLIFTLAYHWNDDSNHYLCEQQIECAHLASRIHRAFHWPLFPFP